MSRESQVRRVSSKVIACVLLFALGGSNLVAQDEGVALSGALTAEQDRARIMALLDIETLPPGASGSDPATYDEAVANPYPVLPDPLVSNAGTRVVSAEQWFAERRPEILEDFAREVYGRIPTETPAVSWQVDSVEDDGMTLTRELTGHVDHSAYPAISVAIELTVATPAAATGPVPLILQLGFPRGSRFRTPRPEDGPSWQEQVLARGWGWAIISPASVQPDNGAGLTAGIIGLVNGGRPRDLDEWGALAAWAWGASRALDFFEADEAVDATRVGLQGHSRYGKAAIVALAFDQRFAIGYISSSGAGGAKLHRRRYGERVSLDGRELLQVRRELGCTAGRRAFADCISRAASGVPECG
jgi:hypothetical protein